MAVSTVLEDYPAEGVLRLTISNPAKRNALDHATLAAIAAALRSTGAQCVILTGAGEIFSSGYDIVGLPADDFEGAADRLVAHPHHSALDALDAVDLPTIAACAGPVLGGGLELALACDLRVAAEDAVFGIPASKLGLVYSHTGVRRVLEAIGPARTRELFLVGGQVGARVALDWGLVNRVVESAELQRAALRLAHEIAANAPLAVTGNKRVIRTLLGARRALDPAAEQELAALRRAGMESADFREGVTAFAEKRPARWQRR